jgi:oxygen-independent coproporphyrinogen-3 oxidase
VHVPFCAQKCSYCAFYSEAASGEVVNRYVSSLIRELEWVATDLRPRTIFFGGGTPSLLNLRQWEQVLRAMERLKLLGAAEWTVECNPATVSVDKARLLHGWGVNRISMGVQSLDADLLDRLGRVHTREMVFKSFDALRQAGFDNVNVDLMFAIPGQSKEVWQRTLTEALALGSEHLSCYEVIYEEDTPLYARMKAGEFSVDEALACSMYEELIERAANAGLARYEVANFAREGRACRHNINYWRGGSCYGVGPSATGYVRGTRERNVANTVQYCEQVESGRRPVASTERLTPLGRAGETAAFGLRMTEGWPFEEFLRSTGYDLRREWAGDMSRLERQGWGYITPERFHLTAQGLRFADAAAELFLRTEPARRVLPQEDTDFTKENKAGNSRHAIASANTSAM